jgi:hypothetical protein
VNAIAGITYCYAGNTSTYDTDWPTLLKEVLLFDCVFQSNNGTYWGIPDDKPVGTHEIVAASTAAYGEGVCEGQAYGLSGAYFDVNIPPYYDSTGGWGMCSS